MTVVSLSNFGFVNECYLTYLFEMEVKIALANVAGFTFNFLYLGLSSERWLIDRNARP